MYDKGGVWVKIQNRALKVEKLNERGLWWVWCWFA